jgi:hypothetical protein
MTRQESDYQVGNPLAHITACYLHDTKFTGYIFMVVKSDKLGYIDMSY